MIVMPANSTGWFWHVLARETGRFGHLYSPGAQPLTCGPWPWFPYALDNGAFSCWNQKRNTFDFEKWESTEQSWRQLLFWAQAVDQPAMWAIVPDVPGDAEATIERWRTYAPIVVACRIPPAVAVQDGMGPGDVLALDPPADVVCVGGTTEWKWDTAEMWCRTFPRVHVLRCNSPRRLSELDEWGCESTDGTGWSRGDRKQTAGLEIWARSQARPRDDLIYTYTCRRNRNPEQMSLA